MMQEDNSWYADLPFATAGSATTAHQSTGRAKTTPQDMQALNAASAVAQSERDAMLTYDQVEQSVRNMDTGPGKAWWLDAITPEQDGGWADSIGGVLGTPFRFLHQDKTLRAREHLNTVNSQVSLATAAQQKGTASNSDMSLIRMAGVSPYKSVAENLRIIRQARHDGHRSGVRAQARSMWITKFGSASQAAPNGLTMERFIKQTEDDYLNNMKKAGGSRNLPKPPPSATRRRSAETSPRMIDIDGRPVR